MNFREIDAPNRIDPGETEARKFSHRHRQSPGQERLEAGFARQRGKRACQFGNDAEALPTCRRMGPPEQLLRESVKFLPGWNNSPLICGLGRLPRVAMERIQTSG